jgi:ADP-heptose:LPS heptosyltransferase
LPSARVPEARRRLLRTAGRLLAPLAPAPRAPRRILLLRPDHIGDVLLTTPALGLVRAAFPDAELTYLVGPWSAEVARRGPTVQVRTLAFPGFTRRSASNLLAPYALLARAALGLRQQAFDVAVVWRPDHWWGALLALAAGVPVRVGYDLPETRPLLTHPAPLDRQQHAAQQALSLARQVATLYGRPDAGSGDPVFRTEPAEHQAAERLLAAHHLTSRGLVVIQPSAGAALKSWPVVRWAALADRLGASGHEVLLVGAPADHDLLRRVQADQAQPSPAVWGQQLGVSAALYARAALLIGPDGGSLHLAAALGTPTLRLFGPAPPSVYGPWPPDARQKVLITRALACAPCGNLDRPPCGAHALPACMLALGVDEVVETALSVLNTTLH